jgi:isoleucyl-tRNA synthetase
LKNIKSGNKNIPFRIEKEIKGSDSTRYASYEQLIPICAAGRKVPFRVIVGDFVSTEDGTGIVHIAPTFGADDFRVAKQHDVYLPIMVNDESGKPMPLVDRQGRFVKGSYRRVRPWST